jgi:hypothetical protein
VNCRSWRVNCHSWPAPAFMARYLDSTLCEKDTVRRLMSPASDVTFRAGLSEKASRRPLPRSGVGLMWQPSSLPLVGEELAIVRQHHVVVDGALGLRGQYVAGCRPAPPASSHEVAACSAWSRGPKGRRGWRRDGGRIPPPRQGV